MEASLLSGSTWRGVVGRRNFLFLRLSLPDPSIRMVYCLCGRVSITIPVLSHLRGFGPVWFWTFTVCPTLSGARFLFGLLFNLARFSILSLAIPTSLASLWALHTAWAGRGGIELIPPYWKVTGLTTRVKSNHSCETSKRRVTKMRVFI